MKKELIRKIMIASLIAVTLTACGKEQDTTAPIEAESETIPEEVLQDILQETPEETPQKAPDESAEEIPIETPENMSENLGERASQTEISGVIENISDGSFVLSETIIEEDTENGLVSMLQPGNDEDKILTTVNYNDQTEIVVSIVANETIGKSEPGSKSDLIKDDRYTYTIEGSWDGDVFQASKINVFKLATD